MLLMVEKGLRRDICHPIYRYAKSVQPRLQCNLDCKISATSV